MRRFISEHSVPVSTRLLNLCLLILTRHEFGLPETDVLKVFFRYISIFVVVVSLYIDLFM